MGDATDAGWDAGARGHFHSTASRWSFGVCTPAAAGLRSGQCLLSSMRSFITFFVCDTSSKPLFSRLNEAETQDAKLLYTWPEDDTAHVHNRMGVVEALLQASRGFLDRNDDVVDSAYPGSSSGVRAKHPLLTIQTLDAAIVADYLPGTELLVTLVCESSRSKTRHKNLAAPRPSASPLTADSGAKMSVASRLVRRFGTVSSTRDSSLKNKEVFETEEDSSQLTQFMRLNTAGWHSDVVDVAVAGAMLDRFMRHFSLFHSLKNLSTVTGDSVGTSSKPQQAGATLSEILSEFVPRFLYAEAAEYGKPHTRMLAGESGIQYGCSSRVGFLHVQGFLFQLMASSVMTGSPSLSLHSTAMFYNGYYVGGSMATEDLAVLYDYLVSYPSGRVATEKHMLPPWTSNTMRCSSYPCTFYGLSHALMPDGLAGSLVPADAWSKTDSKPAKPLPIAGYLYGPGTTYGPLRMFDSPLLKSYESASHDSDPSGHDEVIFLIPRIHLPSGTSVYLVVFVYHTMMLCMLFHELPVMTENHTTEGDASEPHKSPLMDSGIFGRSPSLEKWFRELTWRLLRGEQSLPVTLKKFTAPAALQDPALGAGSRFLYFNSITHALRRSNNPPGGGRAPKCSAPSWKRFLLPKTPRLTNTFTERSTQLRSFPSEAPTVTVGESEWISKLHAVLRQPCGIEYAAVKPSDGAWTVARKTLERKFIFLTEERDGVSLNDLFDEEESFLRNNLPGEFI